MITAPGQGSIREELPSSAASSPQFNAAQKTCRSILPGPQNGSPAQQAAQQQAHKQNLLAFANCLRSHGISGFPDPDSQGRLTLEMVSAAGVDLRSRTFFDAAKACVGVTHGEITLDQIQAAANNSARSLETRKPA